MTAGPASHDDSNEALDLNRRPPEKGWRDWCPWLLIFRALPIACSPTIITFALLATVLAPVGFLISESLFINEETRGTPGATIEELQVNRSTYRSAFPDHPNWSGISILGQQLNGIDVVFLYHVRPVTQMLRFDAGWRVFTYYALGWTWAIVVWSFFGTCICRIAVMRLSRNESVAMDGAFEFAIWKSRSAFSGILLPLIGVILLIVPLALMGLIIKLDLGMVLIGAVWLVALLIGLLMALLLLGLTFSWPLIIASVSTEGQDSFDAMSRTFAYTYRRPVHYVFYMVIALVFGGVVWFLTHQFTMGVIHLTHWGTSFGANIGADRIGETAVGSEIPEASGMLIAGRNLIRFWDGFAKTVGAAFFHGFFWCVATTIYLLLRRDMDRIDFDEVIVVDPIDGDELPELSIDEDGIPSADTVQGGNVAKFANGATGSAEANPSGNDNGDEDASTKERE